MTVVHIRGNSRQPSLQCREGGRRHQYTESYNQLNTKTRSKSEASGFIRRAYSAVPTYASSSSYLLYSVGARLFLLIGVDG